MAPLAIVAKPALWIAVGAVALGAVGVAAYRLLRRRDEVQELLPHVDVAAWNEALMAP